METQAMWCKRFLPWATFGLIYWAGITGTLADGPAKEVRFFATDFRTICECVHKVEHDLGLRESAPPDRLPAANVGADARERAIVVVPPRSDREEVPRVVMVIDREKLPHVEPHQIHVARGVSWSRKEHPHLGRTIRLDPDTGVSEIDPGNDELSESAGLELVRFRANSFQISKYLTYDHDKKRVRVEIARHYPDERIKVQITGLEKDEPAICRELMASLDAKLKLASKLKDAKERTHRAEAHHEPKPPISEKK
jgi:hypothetical protein